MVNELINHTYIMKPLESPERTKFKGLLRKTIRNSSTLQEDGVSQLHRKGKLLCLEPGFQTLFCASFHLTAHSYSLQ